MQIIFCPRPGLALLIVGSSILGGSSKTFGDSGSVLRGERRPVSTTSSLPLVTRSNSKETGWSGRIRPADVTCAEPSPDVAAGESAERDLLADAVEAPTERVKQAEAAVEERSKEIAQATEGLARIPSASADAISAACAPRTRR